MLYGIIVGIVIFLISLYLYCIMPRTYKKTEYRAFRKRSFAHRGFHNKKVKRPENSIPAFMMAVEHGYGIELDVQLTKDNQVVVFHDFNLKRICGVEKKVYELNYDELKKYHLLDSEEHMPLLSEVLQKIDGKVPLLIELKCRNKRDHIAPAVAKLLAGYKGEYYIQSFHPLALRWYKKNQPQVMRGQLAECYERPEKIHEQFVAFLQQHLIFNFVCRPDFISYNWKHQKEVSLNVCKYMFRSPIAAWTVHSKEELKKSQARFDVIIFENFYM